MCQIAKGKSPPISKILVQFIFILGAIVWFMAGPKSLLLYVLAQKKNNKKSPD